MNLYEALDALSGYLDMFADMGVLSDEEIDEICLIEDTIREYIAMMR